jgi:hypothetical protein
MGHIADGPELTLRATSSYSRSKASCASLGVVIVSLLNILFLS